MKAKIINTFFFLFIYISSLKSSYSEMVAKNDPSPADDARQVYKNRGPLESHQQGR